MYSRSGMEAGDGWRCGVVRGDLYLLSCYTFSCPIGRSRSWRTRQPLDIRPSTRRTHLAGNSSLHGSGVSPRYEVHQITMIPLISRHLQNISILKLHSTLMSHCFGSNHHIPKSHSLTPHSRVPSVRTARQRL